MMECRVVGWDLGACAAAQGTRGYAAVCGAVAISDKAGVCVGVGVCVWVCASSDLCGNSTLFSCTAYFLI